MKDFTSLIIKLHAVRRLSPARKATLSDKNPGVVPNQLNRPNGEVVATQRGENHSVYDQGKDGSICISDINLNEVKYFREKKSSLLHIKIFTII